MPTAICNQCQSLVTWQQQRGSFLKHQACSCGSHNLTAVTAKLNEEGDSWEYKDRNGNTRKIVSRDTKSDKICQ